MRLVSSALAVSDYTGRIDTPRLAKSPRRQHQQLREICGQMTGIMISFNTQVGRELGAPPPIPSSPQCLGRSEIHGAAPCSREPGFRIAQE